MTARTNEDGIAIVGIGTLLPGALSASDFWRNCLSGRELMRDVPAGYWLAEDFYDADPRAVDKVYCKRGAFLDPVDFDPMRYGVPPKLLTSTDTCQLLSLMVADQVLRDTFGDRFEKVSRDRIGVVLGVCSGLELVGEMAGRLQRPAWVKTLREHGLPEDQVQAICDALSALHPDWNEATFPGLLNNVVTGRVANHFDLGGPNFTTDAACASSFAALAMAANMLRQRDADLVITGGADTTNDPFTFMCFSKTPALSLASTCRPFSESADGTMLGEGISMFALKRLVDAERDGDRVYAVVRGCGSSSDGRAKSIYAPRWEGQVKSLERCYEQAGYGPETVELIEAHGTGTKAGDLAEFTALKEVYGASAREQRQWCALGSIKSQLGHTKATAGAVGLLKVVLALHEKVLPPTMGVDRPAAKMEIEKTPFYLNSEARPWIHRGDSPRRASVSSFGFGGTNFHIAVEEYTGRRERARRVRAFPTELILLSESTRAMLAKSALELAAAAANPRALCHIARETQQRFRPEASARLAVIAADTDELRTRLTQAAESLAQGSAPSFAVPGNVYFSEQARDGGLAFVFPGQGSQYVGMGADLAMSFDTARSIWDAEAAMASGGQLALHEVVFPRPVFTDAERDECAARLRGTAWAQPSIGAMSASLFGLLRGIALKPDCVAGHSFGEISALYAADSLDCASFLRVARGRGELMASALQNGGGGSGMAAVTASLEQVEALIESSGVTVANHNDPRQVVVSGRTSAIEDAERRFVAAGLKVQKLPVAAAFHSPVVAGSVGPFANLLRGVDFKRPSIPVVANATAQPYPDEPEAIRELLASSIARRVRFLETIESMYARGVRTFVEVGPGAALTGMVSRICGERHHRAVALDRSGRHGITSLWQGLAQVAVAGHAMNFSAFWDEFDLGPDPRAQPKPKMTIRISGTNYGKHYPPEGGAAALPRPNQDGENLRERARKYAPGPASAAMARAPMVGTRSTLGGEVMQTKDEKTTDRIDTTLTPNGAAMPRPPGTIKGSLNGAAYVANGASSQSPEGASSVLERTGATVEAGISSNNAGHTGVVVTRDYRPGVGQSDVAAWLSAYEAIQCRTAEAHAVYQQTMAQCHLAFLHAAEQSALALATLSTGAPAPPPTASRAVALPAAPQGTAGGVYASVPMMARAAAGQHGLSSTALSSPVGRAPARQSSPPAGMPMPAATEGLETLGRAPVAAAVPPPPPVAPMPSTSSVVPPAVPGAPMRHGAKAGGALALPADGDLKSFLLSIVSEKTGYPVEVLNLDQQLEADLGIDSIKRVEILSAFEGQIENIQDVNLEEVAKLNTLRDVLGFMERFADKLGLEKKKQ
jgi:acyl transferase domain-containing protein/acyl carrier protein